MVFDRVRFVLSATEKAKPGKVCGKDRTVCARASSDVRKYAINQNQPPQSAVEVNFPLTTRPFSVEKDAVFVVFEIASQRPAGQSSDTGSFFI